jgi:hypothetical protein
MSLRSIAVVRSLIALGALGMCLVAASSARADAKIYEQALQSTTWVLTKVGTKTSSGTGVLVDGEKKLIITNFHVVGEARSALVFFPAMQGDKPIVTRKHYIDNVKTLAVRGRVLGVDRKRDLAVVQLDKLPEGVKAIALAADSPKPGEAVESVGNPGASDALWIYTSGTVRAVYKKQFRTGAGDHDFNVVETQSPINTGDSGGPVVNSAGELVAISQAISPSGRLVSYSVDITEVKAFLASPWKPAPLPVTDVLTAAELEYKQHQQTGHYEVQFDQDDKSKQSVFITKDLEYYEKADTRKIWALAATLKQAPKLETALKLLDQNGRTKLGSWSIEQTQSGEFLVIYCAKLDATAAPVALRSTMEYVAKLTTIMKKELAPSDTKVAAASDNLDDWLK